MAAIDTAGPVSGSERIAELDVLRGIALVGVLTMNLVWIVGYGVGITEAQATALPSDRLDFYAYWGRWLIGDKANTVFATFFGLGFFFSFSGARASPVSKRYQRRLGWLLLFGILNVLFLWVGDILYLCAIAGLMLLTMSNWSTRGLVIFGAIAALYSDKVQEWLIASGRWSGCGAH